MLVSMKADNLLVGGLLTPNRILNECSTRDIRSQLVSWKEGLPLQLTLMEGNCLRLNVHLQLHYSMIWICIGRGALIDRVRSLLGNKEPTKDDLDAGSGSQELSDACADHAARIIDLIDLLKSRGQLGLFSYTDFHTCSSATIIVLLDSILNPRLTSFLKVSTAMNGLRFMATGSDLARNNLKYVEDFQGVVNKALASMYRRDYEELPSTRGWGSLSTRESPRSGDVFLQSSIDTFHPASHQGVGIEELGHQRESQGPNTALFYDIKSMLEDCSLTDLHLLGFNDLCSNDVLYSNNGC